MLQQVVHTMTMEIKQLRTHTESYGNTCTHRAALHNGP